MEKLRFLIHKKNFRLLLMISTIILCVLAFTDIVDDVFYDASEGDDEAMVFDNAISSWVQGFRTPMLTQAMTDLTALGSISVIGAMFLVMASILMTYKDYRGIFYLMTVLAGAGVLPTTLKLIFKRPRPELTNQLVTVTDYSFPSGHSFGATALYIGLAYYAAKYAQSWRQEIFFYLLGMLLIITVGTTRIYLGVHYPTDVLAGISGGIAWGLLVSSIFEIFKLTSSEEVYRP